uniref:Uncharacterized protein n=1 Tax=Populus trichocarpa TaxID=3694 RepID=A9PG73_POPTR|nr:unknown [Populus trichocarpa]
MPCSLSPLLLLVVLWINQILQKVLHTTIIWSFSFRLLQEIPLRSQFLLKERIIIPLNCSSQLGRVMLVTEMNRTSVTQTKIMAKALQERTIMAVRDLNWVLQGLKSK